MLSAWNAWNDRVNAGVVSYYTRNVFTYKELRLQPQGTHKPWTQVEEGCAGDESRQDCVSPIKGGSVVGYRKKTLPFDLQLLPSYRPQKENALFTLQGWPHQLDIRVDAHKIIPQNCA